MVYSDYKDNFAACPILLKGKRYFSKTYQESQKGCMSHDCQLGQSPRIFQSHLHSSLGFKLWCYVQVSEQTMRRLISGAVFSIFMSEKCLFIPSVAFSWLVFNSPNRQELTHLGYQQNRDLNLELRHPKWPWNIHQICLADAVNILLSGWRELVFPLTLPPLKSTSFHLKKFCWKFLWMPYSDHHVGTPLIHLS